ncbi:hypothetical protein [Actinomadura roseirufa]|uniref:hypothetical protein n=1 Tax=Actinomadura roseirufa TaxID=2094049 RepID=UPI0010412538|nr:hypothetical protein [Actinomadura roseirufa]
MSKADAREEIARMAREARESIGQFASLDELLRSTLPRLADPGRDAEFDAAVEELTGRLDETAVHRLAMLLSELWLYWNTAEPIRPDVPARPFPVEETSASQDRGALPDVTELVVNLASYVGSAALGGVIGNRADIQVRRVLDVVRARWQSRRGAPDTPLTREEAIEVVDAAAAVHGYDTGGAELLETELRDDGAWLVRLGVDGETLTAVVPPGDPGRARVVIRVS